VLGTDKKSPQPKARGFQTPKATKSLRVRARNKIIFWPLGKAKRSKLLQSTQNKAYPNKYGKERISIPKLKPGCFLCQRELSIPHGFVLSRLFFNQIGLKTSRTLCPAEFAKAQCVHIMRYFIDIFPYMVLLSLNLFVKI
jgi:hypothetical protein